MIYIKDKGECFWHSPFFVYVKYITSRFQVELYIEKISDILDMVSMINDNDIVFIDEAHKDPLCT